jgi:aminopeptidase
MTFQEKLEALARLTVRVGNNVQPGQRLYVRAPLETAPFVRLVTRAAYEAGAKLVDVYWVDDFVTLERLRHADPSTLSEVAEGQYRAREDAAEHGDAFLSISASDPGMFETADGERLATIMRAVGARARPSLEAFGSGKVNWSIVAYSVPSWARRVFPGLDEDTAVAKLWEAIFTISRADQPDPVAAWTTHLDALEARRDLLNAQRLTALEFKAPGTDLRIQLPELHRWEGGSSRTVHGVRYVPNIPTEEVFTAPHRAGVNGTVRASKPLSYAGKIIEGIEMEFKDGRVTHARAATHEDALHRLLDTDEGAARLGEVALVASSSPVAKSGLLFQETLYDENAACHIAQGRAYQYTLQDGNDMTKEEFVASGGNDSQVHVDWMIGSDDMNVDGILPDGSRMPVLRDGEWAFQP